MRATAFGRAAWLLEVDHVSPAEDARAARQIAAALSLAFPEADVVGGGAAVLVVDAPDRSPSSLLEVASSSTLRELGQGRNHVIQVVYDGPDLQEVAKRTGLSVEEVTRRHERSYTVEVTGFLPGFGYLAELDASLRLPRRAAPRRGVRAGSVAIAGRFTGVYPFDSPGGWHLIGRAVDTPLFDPTKDPPTLLAPGDSVRFVGIEAAEEPAPRPAPFVRTEMPGAHLAIVYCPPHATVQDRGRRLRGRGIPTSGAADLETHDAANAALGNDPGAATVELPIDRFEAEVLRELWLSVDGASAERLRAGDRLRVPRSERAVRYLAVEGGIDVPIVLGSRATLAVASLGGFGGRRLRRGDRLRAIGDGGDASRSARSGEPPAANEIVTIPITPGPHLSRFPEDALSQLCTGTRVISTIGDRVGVRLEGDPIRRQGVDDAAPEPMLPGAVQISTDGAPIVLGPDSAVTGGYPVLAVVTVAGRSLLARCRPGHRIRFTLAG